MLYLDNGCKSILQFAFGIMEFKMETTVEYWDNGKIKWKLL